MLTEKRLRSVKTVAERGAGRDGRIRLTSRRATAVAITSRRKILLDTLRLSRASLCPSPHHHLS